MRGFDFKIIILAVLTCIVFILYRQFITMKGELDKINIILSTQENVLKTLTHESDTKEYVLPASNKILNNVIPTKILTINPLIPNNPKDDVIDIKTLHQVPMKMDKTNDDKNENVNLEKNKLNQFIQGKTLPNSSCELETSSDVEDSVSYSNTSQELAIYSNDNDSQSVLSSVDNIVKKKNPLVEFEGDNLGVDIPTLSEKSVEVSDSCPEINVYNLNYDTEKESKNVNELNLNEEINVNENNEISNVLVENNEDNEKEEILISVESEKEKTRKKKTTVPLLLRNKLAELQDIAEGMDISIVKNVNGNSKRKTKLELAKDILKKKISN